MKLLSIDIGIKNMGVCLFEIIDNNFNIIEWNILDLLCLHKCSVENCEKPVKFYKNNEYYCKVHAKKHNTFYIPPDDISNINKIKNEKLSNLYELCSTHDISYNTPITKNELLIKIQEHIHNKYFNIYETENCNDIDLIKVGINMNIQLNNFMKYHNDIKQVIIENQISPIANRMKTIQGMTSQYFINNNIHNIVFVSSFNKLKLFSNKKLSYREKKKLSVEITTKFLDETSQMKAWKEMFNKSKKKDDLADSFLQGYYYLINNQLINKLF